MRGRSGGLWLPALVLTALSVAGVVVLLAVGAPVVPRSLPGFLVSGDSPDKRHVNVPPSRSQSPTAPAPSGTTPTASPRPSTPGPGEPGEPAGPGDPTGRPTERPSSGSSSSPGTRPSSKPPATTAAPTPTKTASPAPSCKPGSVTVNADADSYVDQAAPGQNFGAMSNLHVTSRDKSRNRRALVRFPMPLVPSGCSLRAATLTLTAREASGRQLVVTRAATPWSEGAVTWNNAPAPGGASSAAATVAGTTVQWTVTSLVSSMLANGNYGFLVRDASENARGKGEQTNFNARSSNGAPTLFLRWS